MANESKSVEVMLSTSDNPFNPFTEPRDWFFFDYYHGYNTLGYLARVAEEYGDGVEIGEDLAWKEAVEDGLRYNLTGNRIKVEKPVSV